MNNEALQFIFEKQKQFQTESIGDNIENLTEQEKSKFIHEHSYFIIEEVTEMLRECYGHKSWKDYSDWDQEKLDKQLKLAQEEATDVFVFLINVMFMLDIDADKLIQLYQDKLEVNKKRQTDASLGYVKETPEDNLQTKNKETRNPNKYMD